MKMLNKLLSVALLLTMLMFGIQGIVQMRRKLPKLTKPE